jgi:tetratricopeptide (TPR) repeat protein
MKAAPALVFAFLLSVAFTLGVCLQPRVEEWTAGRGSDNLVQVLLGDGRQILANHLFVEADVYFHSGYYPSVFDQSHAPTNSAHMTSSDLEHGHDEHDHDGHDAKSHEEEHEKAMSFLDEPRDWIERFGRNFRITTHTHLSGGKEREMLPWLRLSASLDPHRIETYTVASFWLRKNLGKPKEAEQFLREGLNANPDSYEILIELGRLYNENYHDTARARNVWEAALKRWNQKQALKEKEAEKDKQADKARPDLESLDIIVGRLAHLEEDEGHYAKAIEWLEFGLAKDASPNPNALRQHITELRAKMAGQQPKAPPQ